jgi:hypothetical protein
MAVVFKMASKVFGLEFIGGAQPIFPNSSNLFQQSTVGYLAPFKKFAQTAPSVDGVFSFFNFFYLVRFPVQEK